MKKVGFVALGLMVEFTDAMDELIGKCGKVIEDLENEGKRFAEAYKEAAKAKQETK